MTDPRVHAHNVEADDEGRRTKARVLLAEDDAEMRSLLANSLRADGHEVVETGDGGRLLVCVGRIYMRESDPFDLLVSDVRMPVCSGLQILEKLRLAHWREPAILMTAFGDARTRAKAQSLGACMLMKPFDLDDFRTVVKRLVG